MDVFTAESGAHTEEMLQFVASKLNKLGYVKDGYAEALIEREKDHPTGLAVKDLINVAIPHADAEYALRQAIVVIAHPDSCFRFRKMDEPEESICVEIVFLMVVKESDGYLKFLSDLTELIQDREFIRTVKNGGLVPVANLLAKALDRHDLTYEGPLDLPTTS
jgi:PTS system galactitol-specific IIA component